MSRNLLKLAASCELIAFFSRIFQRDYSVIEEVNSQVCNGLMPTVFSSGF